MTHFRKKPVVIEAIQWTGKNLREVIAFTGALTPGSQYSANDLRSRWQLKLGLRLSF